MPLPKSRPLQVVAVEDIAGFVRLVLERPSEFQGKRIDIASDSLTGPEMAKAMSQANGSDISYVEASLDAVRAQSPDLARMWEWFDQVGYSAEPDALVYAYPEVGWHDF
ncbi:MAG: NmrA family NAD(P)-binding protein, partial [Myxococcales bacterium]